MNEEFDAEACAEAMREEIEWQMKEWERERKEDWDEIAKPHLKEYATEIKNLMESL